MPAAAPPVDTLLANEAALLAAFVSLLETEQAHLVAGETDPLLALAELKTTLADKLTAASQARARASGGEVAGHPRWVEILTLADKAKQLNTLNGRLIGQRMAHNQQALQVLMTATERSAVYGPDGQPRHGGGGRTLGRA